MPKELAELTVDTWGPIFWKLLHILSTRVGGSGDVLDADAANAFYYVINQLPTVLPCAECQGHMKTYLAEHKFEPRGLVGAPLRLYVETWLLNFHNAVRIRKGQVVEIETVAEYHARWSLEVFKACDNESLELFFKYGKMYHVINVANHSRWTLQLKRLRIMLSV